MAIGKCSDETDIDQERVTIRFGDTEVYPTRVDEDRTRRPVGLHAWRGGRHRCRPGDRRWHGDRVGLRPDRRLRPHQRRLHDLTRLTRLERPTVSGVSTDRRPRVDESFVPTHAANRTTPSNPPPHPSPPTTPHTPHPTHPPAPPPHSATHHPHVSSPPTSTAPQQLTRPHHHTNHPPPDRTAVTFNATPATPDAGTPPTPTTGTRNGAPGPHEHPPSRVSTNRVRGAFPYPRLEPRRSHPPPHPSPPTTPHTPHPTHPPAPPPHSATHHPST